MSLLCTATLTDAPLDRDFSKVIWPIFLCLPSGGTCWYSLAEHSQHNTHAACLSPRFLPHAAAPCLALRRPLRPPPTRPPASRSARPPQAALMSACCCSSWRSRTHRGKPQQHWRSQCSRCLDCPSLRFVAAGQGLFGPLAGPIHSLSSVIPSQQRASCSALHCPPPPSRPWPSPSAGHAQRV